MNRALLCAALLAASSYAQAAVQIGDEEAKVIGRKIWENESGEPNDSPAAIDALTHWNKGENFPSLGIGHFIWYKAGEREKFVESFPKLIDAISASGHLVPSWLQGTHCPWVSSGTFKADFRSPRMNELRSLLLDTMGVQARFMASRLEAAQVSIDKARPDLTIRLERVATTPNGRYALVDYVNFKGEGLSPDERYNDMGWGLLWVLDEMGDAPTGQPAVAAFAAAAETVLERRIGNSPPARGETRWRKGWIKRVRTYPAH